MADAEGILTVGFTEEEIITILNTVKAALIAGESVVNYGGEGISVNKQLFAGMGPKQVLKECQHALRQLNPEQYAPVATSIKFDHGGNFET